ncbi:hypothetical protein B0J11DRAFT_436393 [Dendryphion nanum]|uniref:Uncharacterized protein n=1 Tax=Dendryphion nanum TaxID=256645 RepID=A0A9P9ILX7_9PLEO|nr:hypothetical protein B0J11DRAFT_436393 [Dendryphion nanum]
MPALTIPSPTTTRPTSPSESSTSASQETVRSRSQSPARPPVSPITPTVSVAQLAPIEPLETRKHVLPPPLATFRTQPPPVSISESENPDAIALRSAISLLQLQREKSKRDLKILQDLKTAAVSDPQGFVRSIQEQRAKPAPTVVDPLAPTLSYISSPAPSGSGPDSEEGFGTTRKDSGAVPSTPEKDTATKFAPIPQPQNIIRCPPVNWHKYQIVGEPLDKLHEEQKRWPGSKEPPRTGSGARAPPHSVAAPYSPFTDGHIEPQNTNTNTNTNRGSKKSLS